jgi:hypothetical protein
LVKFQIPANIGNYSSSYPQKWSFILKGGFIRGWHVSGVLGRFSAVWFSVTGACRVWVLLSFWVWASEVPGRFSIRFSSTELATWWVSWDCVDSARVSNG